MARDLFGRILALVAFACAVFLGAEWIALDRPTAWLARLAGDEARSAPHSPSRAADVAPPPPPAAAPVAPSQGTTEVTRAAVSPPAPGHLPVRTAEIPVPSVVGAP